MASLIVVQGFRPVSSGLDEWVGVGKGGKNLRQGCVIELSALNIDNWLAGKSSHSTDWIGKGVVKVNAYHDAMMKSLVRRWGRPKSAQFMTFQRTLKPLEVNILITALKKIG